MAAANSTLYKLSIGGTPVAIACQTGVNWEASQDLVEVSCKDFNGFKSYRGGAKGASINVEGIIDLAAATGASSLNLAAALLASTLLEVTADTSEAAYGISGDAYVENFSCDAPGIEEPVTFSATLRLSGTYAIG